MTTPAISDAAMAHLRALAADASADRYELGATLGEGGVGTVYLARDRELGREVALKVLRARRPTPAEHARILREARILAALEHPGIVPVHDVGTLPDGRVFYVMKRVRGQRLDEWARRTPPPSRAERLRAFRQLCDAVAFAHAAGVIHRDLKPQNVMLGAFGELLVLDWGVARWLGGSALGDSPGLADSGDTGTGTVLGTLGYMAPEQRDGRGAAPDERSDVHGLGGILVFLLAGEHPRDGEPVPAGERWHALPAPLRAICARARAADPAARYPTAAALGDDVARFLDGEPVSAHRERLLDRARRFAARHRVAIALVLAYLAMRVALLLLTRR